MTNTRESMAIGDAALEEAGVNRVYKYQQYGKIK